MKRSLFFTLVLAFIGYNAMAQKKAQFLPPPANEINYYIDISLPNAPNEDGTVNLILYKRNGTEFSKEEVAVDTKEVFNLYVISPPIAEPYPFPTITYQFSNLRTLFLGGLNFVEMPENTFEKFPNLEYLDLQSTPISKLPASINQLNYLNTLYISGTKIPKGELPNIKKIIPEGCSVVL